MNESVIFLKKINELSQEGIPGEVMARARQALLDYFAVTLGGSCFQREKLENYINFAQLQDGDCTVIGLGRKLDLKEAVFLNGLNSHALDFDDGTNSGIIHLGAPIFSLLIPLAEKYDISLNQMLRAAILGYEVSYTMAVSIQPRHKSLGYHATGTCGTLGAAVAASYMLDYTKEECFHAFAAACISASGMLKALDDTSELKPYNVAKTSLLALTSIQLAKAGFRGSDDPLGGRGFLRMMTMDENVKLKPILLNGSFAIMKTYIKPYASCRYTHPSVEAAIRLRGRIDAKDVKEIGIKTYSLAVSGHDHTDIPNPYSAKMSIPYAAAIGLFYGKAGLREFSIENIKNKNILSLTKKIHVEADQKLSEMFPLVQTAILNVILKDGTILAEQVDYPKGEPENPLSPAEFKERYDELIEYAGIKRVVGDRMFQLIHSDRNTTSMRTVIDLLL